MSDRELRELERRWRESQSDDDEARYLAAQVRIGQLEQAALARCAHLGHPAALLAGGDRPPRGARWFKTQGRRRWAKAIEGWGPEPMQRAALAEARHQVQLLTSLEANPAGDQGHVRACRAALQAHYDMVVGELLRPDPARTHRLPLAGPLRAPEQTDAREAFDRGFAAANAGFASSAAGWWENAATGSDEAFAGLQSRLRDDLVPWILGRFDPLRLGLSELRIASPCEVSWDDMQGDDRARHCGACDRVVYDLSALSRAEAEALVREQEGELCAQFYQRPDGTKLSSDCPVGLRALTAPYSQPRMLRGYVV